MAYTKALNLSADVIDTRDIIERIEELETEISDWEGNYSDDGSTLHEVQGELEALTTIMEGLKGNGGDEQWRGDWYPVTLIRDSYFKHYAQELAEDCGMIQDNAQWPCTCIDWDQAARELRYDYTSTEVNGVTYWYR